MLTQDIKHAILLEDSLSFCRKFLFSPTAWIFDDASGEGLDGTYYEFRCTIGDAINENPNNVAIVGSAKFGVSLTPTSEKAFQQFNEKSDIDIVIVSQRLFAKICDAYRKAFYNGYYWLKDTHAKNIFSNFVILHSEERDEYKSTYLRDIWLEMEKMKSQINLNHRISKPIKFRIYASWEDAENYHLSGIDRLKEQLQ